MIARLPTDFNESLISCIDCSLLLLPNDVPKLVTADPTALHILLTYFSKCSLVILKDLLVKALNTSHEVCIHSDTRIPP